MHCLPGIPGALVYCGIIEANKCKNRGLCTEVRTIQYLYKRFLSVKLFTFNFGIEVIR